MMKLFNRIRRAMTPNEDRAKFKRSPLQTILDLSKKGFNVHQMALHLNIEESEVLKYLPEKSKMQKVAYKGKPLFKYVDLTQEQREKEAERMCKQLNIDPVEYKKLAYNELGYMVAKKLHITDAQVYTLNQLFQINQKQVNKKKGTTKIIEGQEFLDLYWEGWTSQQLADKYGLGVRAINMKIQEYRKRHIITESNADRQARIRLTKHIK